jgi:methyl-accepting chemotaxis protein
MPKTRVRSKRMGHAGTRAQFPKHRDCRRYDDVNLKKLEMEQALEDTHAAARTMAIIYSLRSTEFKVDLKGHMLAGVTAEGLTATADHELVDRTAASIDGVATIFSNTPSGFERISTNVKKSDGTRATGTMLAVDHPAQANLAHGEPLVRPRYSAKIL